MSDMATIRSVISSTERTKKITSAMQLVASSKMVKAQKLMQKARPYADNISRILQHMGSMQKFDHPVFAEPRGEKAVYIVLSSDRGLCGGLNIALFKKVIMEMQQSGQENVCLVGNKAKQFFQRIGGNVINVKTHLGDAPDINEVYSIVQQVVDGFLNGQYDRIYLAYNKYVNVMTQEPVVVPMLPVSNHEEDSKAQWDYIYEPNVESIFDVLVTRYAMSVVYAAVLENNACEQSARMIAMKSATENAEGVIDDLRLAYNKARQAVITTELSEIIAGAGAV